MKNVMIALILSLSPILSFAQSNSKLVGVPSRQFIFDIKNEEQRYLAITAHELYNQYSELSQSEGNAQFVGVRANKVCAHLTGDNKSQALLIKGTEKIGRWHIFLGTTKDGNKLHDTRGNDLSKIIVSDKVERLMDRPYFAVVFAGLTCSISQANPPAQSMYFKFDIKDETQRYLLSTAHEINSFNNTHDEEFRKNWQDEIRSRASKVCQHLTSNKDSKYLTFRGPYLSWKSEYEGSIGGLIKLFDTRGKDLTHVMISDTVKIFDEDHTHDHAIVFTELNCGLPVK